MPRREHIKSESYIEWLKSLGCVLYLPFSESGDLQDRISENDLIRTNDLTGYFAWDSNINMMYFHSPSNNSVKSYTLQTNWDNNTFVSNTYTLLSTFKRKSTSGVAFFFMVGVGFSIVYGADLNYRASGNMANMGETLHKGACVISPSFRYYYDDGNLFGSYGGAARILPSNWGNYDYYVGTCDYTEGGTQVLNKECYVKDIIMFNRELTQSEIRQIQQI